MRRREVVRRLAGAAMGLGAGGVLAGNIDPTRRLYGAPESLRFRRPTEENLLRLVLAREEVPVGVWEEASALAKLAAEVVERPERARDLARDPGAAFSALGYPIEDLALDAPEIRACLLLADERVQQAIHAGDAAAFVQALSESGVEVDPDRDRLAVAFREALQREAAIGLRRSGDYNVTGPLSTVTYSIVAITFAIVFAAVLAIVVLAIETVVYVGSQGGSGGGIHRKSARRLSLSALALQSGSRELALEVRRRRIDETAESLADAAAEAARAAGVVLTHEEAARQVRTVLERLIH